MKESASTGGDHGGGKHRLDRVLNGFDTFSLAVGAMIGWGWVVLAGNWLSNAGLAGAALAFTLGGIAVGLIGLTYAELVSALPFAGGEHVFVERAFGPATSFIATWAIVLGYVSVVAFEAIALPAALVFLFPALRQVPLWEVAGSQVYLTEVLIGSSTAILMTVLNIMGLKTASRLQGIVVLVVVLAGLVLIAGGVMSFHPAPGSVWTGWGGVASVLVMVPFLFVGFDVIPQSAEEINIPHRRVGGILLLSILFGTLFYIGIVLGVGAEPFDMSSAVATATAASALWGSERVGAFIVIAGVAGILTSWNAFLIGGSRAIFAMARVRQLPQYFAGVHGRSRAPHRAIIFIGVLAALAPALGRSALVWIVDAGGLGIVIAYVFVTASFLRLRLREPELERPYKVPGGFVVGSLALLLSIGLSLLYLPGSPSGLVWPQEWAIVAGWAVLGAAAYSVGANARKAAAGRNEAAEAEGNPCIQ